MISTASENVFSLMVLNSLFGTMIVADMYIIRTQNAPGGGGGGGGGYFIYYLLLIILNFKNKIMFLTGE
ncbi:hypothetical protein ACJX0J_040463, partial [Zea mays]